MFCRLGYVIVFSCSFVDIINIVASLVNKYAIIFFFDLRFHCPCFKIYIYLIFFCSGEGKRGVLHD